jgi:hypothetical protein
MGFGDDLAIVGLIMTFVGIGIAILFPTKRRLGYLMFVLAAAVGAWWIYLHLTKKAEPRKMTPTIVWYPSPMKEGQPLGEEQLNAQFLIDGISVDGVAVYVPAIGEILSASKTVTVSFTPDNRDLYNQNSEAKVITVVSTLRKSPVQKKNPPLDVSSVQPIGGFHNQSPVMLKYVLQNRSGRILRISRAETAVFVLNSKDYEQVAKSEDAAWDQFLRQPLDPSVDIGISGEGYVNHTFGIPSLSPEQATELSAEKQLLYFTVRIEDVTTKQDIVEICGRVNLHGGFDNCARHNKP